MGFFAGFFSGFALTSTVLYLTIQVHRANRLEQSHTIREQLRSLNWIASPIGAYDRRLAPKDQPQLDPERARLQPTLKDFLKHRWNEEVETLARKAYESRWEDARDTAIAGWKAALRLMKKE
ncbi:hypothetical protein CNMCM5623_004260 [Aspergillus felis]|uniref:MICOS complex subunit MIC12 n=1 Tax=Aspergillus felis TaxID=1287682 RepID=A0A8H6QG35_9EURO|nr:hypothetical protein CNMCM5623_004260 [Aspergillus felis]KAF7180179.1 hypothetical protein CNMCM7691_009346 [Aspergillus felis]